MENSEVRELLRRHWENAGRDEEAASEIYHEDAILEFRQSGERFRGKANIQGWRAKYPAKLDFKPLEIRGGGDFWVAENLIRYNEGPWMNSISILEFRGDKVARENVYVAEPFEAAEWRKPWAEPAPRD